MFLRQPDDDGALAIHKACRQGAPVEVLRHIADMFPFALQVPDRTGALPLHAACGAGASVQVLQFLVEQDPATLFPGDDDRFNLFPAVTTCDYQGMLPLHLLCGSTNPSVDAVQYLISLHEPAVSHESRSPRRLPFMIACEAGTSVDVLMVLLVENPDVLNARRGSNDDV